MPAKAQISNIPFLVLLNSTFVFLVLLFSIGFYSAFRDKRSSKLRDNNMKLKQLKFNIRFVSFSAIFGFLLIAFDRVFIRGINYSLGLRSARYQWLNSTGGSPISVIGNLLIPYGFICIFFLIIHSESVTKRERKLLFFSAITGIVGHAALNGGRSNILLAIIMVIISIGLRGKNSNIWFKIKPKNIKKIIIIAFAVFYVAGITYSSAVMNNMSIGELTRLGIHQLYGTEAHYFDTIGSISQVLYFIVYFLAYLYHGQWTAQVAYSLPIREGNYTFYTYGIILDKLGIIEEPFTQGYFARTGAFISLPGAFYYDYGFLGVIILSSLIGCLVGLALIFVNKASIIGGTKLAFVYYVLFLAYLSPMLPAHGLMYLNFIVFSFVVLDIINKLLFKKRTNWLNEIKSE
jgi:oligosaccharide repeat unit polymerase